VTGYLDAFVPAFGLLALGWVLKRRLLPDDRVWVGIERLVFWVLTPCLLVSALAPLRLAELPLGRMAGTIWLVLGLGAAMSFGLAWALRVGHPAMTSMLMGGIRFNQLMGFAVVGALYGPEGLALGAVATGLIVPFVQIVSTAAFSLGRPGGLRPPGLLRSLVLNPLVMACLLGFLMAALGGLPAGVAPLLRTLGQASVALGLLSVGAALTLAALRDRLGLQALVMAIKLLVMPALTLLVGHWVGLGPLPLAMAVCFMALPTSSTSYVMARAMGGDAPLMAAITTAEHVASALTLPLWLALAARWHY
jgi:predicted permease